MKTATLFLAFCWAFLFTYSQVPGSGSTINFDGQNDYVNIPNNAALNSSNITIEAWIKADTYGPNPWSNSIVNKEGWAAGNQGYAFRCGQGGRLSFNIGHNGVWYEAVSPVVMTTNKWYHVVGSYDGQVIRIYVNGTQVGSANHTGSISPGSYDVRIGQLSYSSVGGNRLFDGQIDEVRIWNQALSPGRLREWMCKKIDNTHPDFASLVAYWQLDEGTGSTASGSAGTSLTGSLTGSPSWITSGAPVGDQSVYLQAGTGQLGLSHPDGDSLHVSNISGNPTAIHIYRVDQAPNIQTAPAGINQLDTTRYWGVYVAGGTNPTFDLDYWYTGNPMLSNACSIDLAGRTNNASAVWVAENAQDLMATARLNLTNTTPGEYILGNQNLNVSITANGPLSVCQGDSVSLSAAAGSTATYQWQLNGQDISGATDSVFVALASGMYGLTIIDGNCSANPTPLIVQINSLPNVLFDSINPLCLNAQPLSLGTGLPLGGTYSGTGVANGIFDPASAGTGLFSLQYIYTDPNGCADSAQRSIEVLALPTVSLDTFAGICPEANAIQLSGGMPLGGIYSGSGVNNNIFDPALIGPGQFNITYTVTDSNACSNAASQLLEVFTPPSVSAGQDQTICLGDSTMLFCSISDSYLWSTGETTQSISVLPGSNTTYSVIISDQNGCTNMDSVSVNVQAGPMPDAGADKTICEGESATLNVSGGSSFSWSNSQTGNSITVQPNEDTQYIVTAVDNIGCTGKDSVNVFVDPLPTPSGSFTISGGIVSFQNNSLDANTYSWDFGDGSPVQSDFEPSHLYVFNGSYTVTLTAINDCGSVDTTFNVDITASAIEDDLKDIGLQLYPNPVSHSLNIEIDALHNRAISLRLADLKGSVLWQKEIEKGRNTYSTQLDLQHLPAGIYVLKVGGIIRRVVKM